MTIRNNVVSGVWLRGNVIVTAMLCCAFLLLCVPSSQYPIRDLDIRAADSAQYHFIALNLLQGRGYRSRPLGSIESYGEESRLFLGRSIQTPLEDRFRIAAQRGPGYPLFLAAIYAIHGARPDVAIRYQAVLAGLIGVLLVLIARRLWGTYASVGGVIAALLLRHQPEMTYTVSALLSECLAAFLLTLCLFCALWAKRGAAWRELVVGLLMAAAVLTRQALLLTALIYGLFLMFPLMKSWKRALAYAIPCALAFSSWTLFLSTQSGGTVFMASTGFSNMLNGLDPVTSALANGYAAPAIDEKSVADYWGGLPIAETPSLSKEVFRRLPSRVPEVLRLVRFKLKIGFFWLPQSVIWCFIVGTVFASALAIAPRHTDRATQRRSSHWLITAQSRSHSRLMAGVLCSLAALTLILFITGYSHPVILTLCLLFLPCCLLMRMSVSTTMEQSASQLWISSWLFGYLGMTILTIGVRRFVRPYLPVFYLCAVAAVPLLLLYVSGLLDATYHIGGRTLRFRWRDQGATRRGPGAAVDLVGR